VNTDLRFTRQALAAPEYVLELFEPADRVAILVRNRSIGQTVQRIAQAGTIAKSGFQSWLARQNACGFDVFVGMNPVKDGAYRRTKDHIKAIRHLYLDLDRNAEASLERIRKAVDIPSPNFVLDTSPGKHQVVWKVNDFSEVQAESLMHALAIQFDGDHAATDSNRVLRLPGFVNRKQQDEFIVRAYRENDGIYTWRDFRNAIAAPGIIKHHSGYGHSRAIPEGHRSQSELDWAFAKRALARGDEPELVVRRIADYRAEDKAQPDYYARLTVTKAQAKIEQERAALPDGVPSSLRIASR